MSNMCQQLEDAFYVAGDLNKIPVSLHVGAAMLFFSTQAQLDKSRHLLTK